MLLHIVLLVAAADPTPKMTCKGSETGIVGGKEYWRYTFSRQGRTHSMEGPGSLAEFNRLCTQWMTKGKEPKRKHKDK